MCNDPLYVQDWISRTGRGDVAIDVGANVGFYTFRLAVRFNRVIAFEPSAQERLFLIDRKVSMGFKNILVRPEAVSDHAGEADFFQHGSELSSLHDPHPVNEHVAGDAPQKVKLIRLDDLSIDGKVDFLKIDTEGEDVQVIRGARELLKKHRPKIQMEIHRQPDFDLAFDELRALGYVTELVGRWILGYP